MIASIDEHFVSTVGGWSGADGPRQESPETHDRLLAYFDAQLQSRHLDFAARWLQSIGEGFYTIGSAGHEANAAVAMALQPTDPALLHYRSGGFYAARAAQVPGSTPVDDVLHGMAAVVDDQISGGRHKVFGNKALHIIPQTSTIGSHLPRAFGLAFALGRGNEFSEWPSDAVVVCSFGDASANHSTTVGALNAAAFLAHQGAELPLLLVCEDNGIGISTKTPAGWTQAALSSRPGIRYVAADGRRPEELLSIADELVAYVRTERRPAILHLATTRFGGHAGSDAEIAYRSTTEILADYEQDPLLHTADALVRAGVLTPAEVLQRYEEQRAIVAARAQAVVGGVRLDSAMSVAAPTHERRASGVARAAAVSAAERPALFRGKLPEFEDDLTLAQTINAALRDALGARPQVMLFGQDVARKGGVYGITRGLRKQFGSARVFDTLLDEQTILGTALGVALAGHLPIAEIQYLAYLHNAQDQLRGEGATLKFFSNGQYRNGMVVRVAGLAYQKGFGGHFHNDNSLAVLRDVPGLAVAVPSHPEGAAALLRQCLALAEQEGRVCVFVEPIALYHRRDLHTEDDGGWLAPYAPPLDWTDDDSATLGNVRTYGSGEHVLVVTFGNGVPMSLRAARVLEDEQVRCTVLDLQWLSPLPVNALLRVAEPFDHVLVVDETRRRGGVSESVVTALVDGGYAGSIRRVTSVDSFVPLGPAADAVLLSEADIVRALRELGLPFHRLAVSAPSTGAAGGSA